MRTRLFPSQWRSRSAIPLKAIAISVAVTLLIGGSATANSVTTSNPTTVAGGAVDLQAVAPYIALKRVNNAGKVRPVSKSTYVASSKTVEQLFQHLAVDGHLPDGIQIFDARGRLVSIAGGQARILDTGDVAEAEVAEAVRATVEVARKHLLARGCTPVEVAAMLLPPNSALADVLAVSRPLGAEVGLSDHSHLPDPAHVGAAGLPGRPPSDLAPPGKLPATDLRNCLVRVEPVTGHRDNWLHNLWHRISGSS